MMSDLKILAEALYQGDADAVAKHTQDALTNGTPVDDILANGLMFGMNVVGKDFRDGTLFIPEVLMAAEAMKAGMEILKPLLSESDVPSLGRVVVGTVKGDLHDIGKNLVAMLLEGAGFDVIDLGIDVPPETFVEAVEETNPAVVGMSALLTTSMNMMQPTIEALIQAGLRDRVKVIVGGAPVTQEYADQIGADGYASNAASAVDKIRDLLLLAA